jgi:hypothetical protein
MLYPPLARPRSSNGPTELRMRGKITEIFEGVKESYAGKKDFPAKS